ncbi:flagellar assembly peptidoglycan hydrolase FlgJ [Methylobacter sp. Wu8]|uniref:Peptidoglycan hydrolase FlgJ n=1 Tax=Methylobacter tundripaludum TaxID=173365 RepID=A0A2S6H2W4_9GAMM|nr:flagellar assembly peptidoglycan hydrolase FlgJ [Methylobacter tundripaludum]MCF7966586.1 flagellar assembly peptidoglycan hydrolase FlgJ [Methylobacter tundripaludum]PPK71829.1 flagellar protein FlgJ [Methylobacter tundripaludum]
MLSGPQNADVYTDFSGLAKLKTQAKEASPEALKEVAKQFESIFLNNVLKSMREAKLADGIMDNDQSKFYGEMYDQQLALHLSGSPGVGLADLIVKQLSPDRVKNEKQDIEDYLNKFGGVSRGGSAQAHAANRQVSGKADSSAAGSTDDQAKISPYTQDRSPFDEITDIPLDSDSAMNGLKSGRTGPIQSAEEFVSRLHPYAERAARELGVEPKVLLAQAALETGWGRSVIRNSNGSNSYNLFNIKADKSWQGKQAQVATLEFDQGIAKKVNAGFRSYDSYEESFRDYVSFIKNNPRYGEALKKVGNAEQYMHELQRAGYATDPKYANKVISIYQGVTMADFEPDVIMAMNQ